MQRFFLKVNMKPSQNSFGEKEIKEYLFETAWLAWQGNYKSGMGLINLEGVPQIIKSLYHHSIPQTRRQRPGKSYSPRSHDDPDVMPGIESTASILDKLLFSLYWCLSLRKNFILEKCL